MSWLGKSNRWKHLVGGIAVGLGADDWYTAEYVGLVVGGAMEYKDYQWGGKPDWIDLLLTWVGVNIGYLIRFIVL